MGLSYRRSVKIGPVRLNVSQRGIGVSAGVKGAHVSTSSSGRRRLTLSALGFRFVRSLSKGGRR